MTAEGEARKALNRLLRATEKANREMGALEGALARAEGDDFPRDRYRSIHAALAEVEEFCREEGARLQEKILQTGGLEPGRVRRWTDDSGGGR